MTLQGYQLSALPEVAPYAIANPAPRLRESPPEQPFKHGDLVAPAWQAGCDRRGRVLELVRQGRHWLVMVAWFIGEPGTGKVRADQLQLVEPAPIAVGQRVVSDLNPAHWPPDQRLDCLISVGTFMGYKLLPGCGWAPRPVVQFDGQDFESQLDPEHDLRILPASSPPEQDDELSPVSDFLDSLGESSPPEHFPRQQPSHQRRHSPKGQASGWLKERQGNTSRKRPTISLYYCWDEPVQGEAGKEYRRHQLYVPKSAAPMVQQLIGEHRPVADIVAVIKSAPRRRKR